MLTIIVPVFNEKRFIRTLLRKLISIKGFKKQIIVVDDGSTDGTDLILRKEFKKNNQIDKIIYHKNNKGKGAAIKSAQRFVKGDYTGIQDADLEYFPKDLFKIYKLIKSKKLDIIYGSRVLKKNKYQNTKNFTHLIRIWGNVFLTKVSNLINNQKLTDAHTCYKVFKSEIFKKIDLKEKGFAFCPEVTTKLSNKGYEIHEVSISYNGRAYSDGKKITSFDGIVALYCLIKYKLFN